MKLIENIKKDEGFSGMPYKDTKGNLTIGYGTKLPLTKEEAHLLLVHRLNAMKEEAYSKCNLLQELPLEAQDIIFNMIYNMGVPSVCKFKHMWEALAKRDYVTASKEMLDSKWAKEDVGKRAVRLANRMKGLANG